MSLYKEDKAAAFTGLIVGSVLIFALVYGIVQWTNAKFAGHAKPAAGATH